MIYGVAEHLPKDKYEITIMHPSSVNRSVERYKDKDNITIEYFPSYFLGKIGYTIPYVPEPFLKKINSNSYDFIHYGDYFYPTSIFSFLNKTSSFLISINALPGYNWFYGTNYVDIISKFYTYSIGKKIIQKCPKIVVIYKKLINDLVSFGIGEEKISLIPNGVDVEKFGDIDSENLQLLKNRLHIDDDEKILLFVGRISKIKRIEKIVDISSRLFQEGFKIKTLIVGDGPYKKEIEDYSKKIDSKVLFCGWVEAKNLPLFYSLANLVVLPSLSEGLPNILLEAGAAKKPSVAFNINGTSDIILHGRTGFLASRDIEEQFYLYCKRILSDSMLEIKMGNEAFLHIQENFSWKKIIPKYETVYNQLQS